MDIRVKVGVVIINQEGSALLIRERLEKKPVALWNIIKGSYDGNETIFEAAKRECKEEASLEIELIRSLGVYVSEEPGKVRVQFNFLAEAHNKTANVASQKEQESRGESIEEVRWFTRDEIMNMSAEDFVSLRTYELLRDWVSGRSFPLESYKQVEM